MAVTLTAKNVNANDVISHTDHNSLVLDTQNLLAAITAIPKGEKGDTGAAGTDGLSVKSLALTTKDGKVTGGTLTFSDNTTAAVTVTEAQ